MLRLPQHRLRTIETIDVVPGLMALSKAWLGNDTRRGHITEVIDIDFLSWLMGEAGQHNHLPVPLYDANVL